MKAREYKSLQFNESSWAVSYLGEQVILLQGNEDILIEKIHQSSKAIEEVLGPDLLDLVPAYDSIALFTRLAIEEVITRLANPELASASTNTPAGIHLLPICYEFGEDLQQISEHCGLVEEEIISLHLQGTYRSLFIGFTPGFIYADGLDPKLSCPRKSNPRTKVAAGSVGIGGAQTGIYSLDSPGGWNIIGRTPQKVFEVHKTPPMAIEVGNLFQFERITKEQFEQWEN